MGKSQMTSLSEDAVSAALLGAVLGYLAHAHWPTLEWLIQLLIS
jgi:F0F1-type ATP synthase assembly protein I